MLAAEEQQQWVRTRANGRPGDSMEKALAGIIAVAAEEESLLHWAQRLSVRPEDLELAAAAWRAEREQAEKTDP